MNWHKVKLAVFVSGLMALVIIMLAVAMWLIYVELDWSETIPETIVDDDVGFLNVEIVETQKYHSERYVYRTYISMEDSHMAKQITNDDPDAKFIITITGTFDPELFSESKTIDGVTFYKNQTGENKVTLIRYEQGIMDWIFNDDVEVIEKKIFSEYKLEQVHATLTLKLDMILPYPLLDTIYTLDENIWNLNNNTEYQPIDLVPEGYPGRETINITNYSQLPNEVDVGWNRVVFNNLSNFDISNLLELFDDNGNVKIKVVLEEGLNSFSTYYIRGFIMKNETITNDIPYYIYIQESG